MSPTKNNRHIRRYRINPVEIVIFVTASFALVNSTYHLFYDHPSFSTPILTKMNSNPITEGRSLASLQTDNSVEIACGEGPLQETSFSKIRLKGQICGVSFDSDEEETTIMKKRRTNQRLQSSLFKLILSTSAISIRRQYS